MCVYINYQYNPFSKHYFTDRKSKWLVSLRQCPYFSDPCGGVLEQNSGTFKSVDENSDGNYENDEHCLWNITVTDRTTVQLKFMKFDIFDNKQICAKDYVKVLLLAILNKKESIQFSGHHSGLCLLLAEPN